MPEADVVHVAFPLATPQSKQGARSLDDEAHDEQDETESPEAGTAKVDHVILPPVVSHHSKTPQPAIGRRPTSPLALLGTLHTDAFVRGVRADHRDLGVVDSSDAHVGALPGCARVRSTDDLVLAGLVSERSPT